ncbi:MAG: YciI family protein [Acidimicrobiales bacterium]
MAKFLVVYRGGQPPEDGMTDEGMADWMGWFGSLGPAVTDMGNPFVGATSVGPDGSRSDDTAGLQGYSIIEADSLDSAADAASRCPQLKAGGSVEVYETLPM